MALFLTEDDVSQVLTMDLALAAVEGVFGEQAEGRAINRPRQRVRTGNVLLHVLPGGTPTNVGLKFYCGGPGGVNFWAVLFDAKSGELLSLMRADKLGQMRTGAASGIASKHLANPGASIFGVFGTGWQAESQVEAVCKVRPIREVRVFGRNREKAEGFCRRMAERTGASFSIAATPEQVVSGAHIVTTITTASDPLFDGHHLEPGAHVNAAGSNRATAREIDRTTVSRAALVVVDSVEQAKLESGDLLAAERDGVFRWERAVELADIVGGKRTGRQDPAQITLFSSHGIALWDIAVATEVYKLARERGLGKDIPL